ncbi:AbrB/MazE/SpoVT family DNA-binding domain-containing protein [Synoicihabitans lomoniglobus]|uniref:AbrB/MazE/SpoVT family DNA-binding domain-containing protein n=1 Tax=Synoicihabitans lomoniglobus TaxID=2909285 RepID=A0AAE9ZT47_9BACT|nr:AbrB/MazE/SpoVT family DNA-binding domain-containing protein [Opitutaceae bacterium LMO-M01]WED63781.1 AbrB/MazE/SpoVT family DNA-binding domain-containing protein [Opitutaceae bacterium LMO-M01]
METLITKLTSKGQTTIPQRVRLTLGLRTGDALAFRFNGDRIEIAKAQPLDLTFAESTAKTLAPEWMSEADDDAFRDL